MKPQTTSEKMASFVGKPEDTNLCVLLYSGGLDTSCMLKWIQENYDCEVVSLTVDVGQKTKDFIEIERKAKELGVKKHYMIDAKKEFAEEYVFPALKANALYEGIYPLSSSLSRPLIAKWGVKVAEREGADAVAHGCSGKGNDNVRFNVTVTTLNPDLKIVAPVVEWNMSREEEIEYAKQHGIPLETDSPYSIDENLWGRSIECGILEHPDQEPPEEVFAWTTTPEKAPNTPEYVEIEFERGIPVSLNGEGLEASDLIIRLNEIGGRHGVGRLDHMEDRIVGLKSREVYECPAATILIQSHKDVEKAVSTRHEVMYKQWIDQQWAYLAYAGLWVDPAREDLDAFIDKVNEKVEGVVKTKLYKGHSKVVGRQSRSMLYDYNLATYGERSTFNQKSSMGFIELWGLQSKMANLAKRER